ncbi:hypothetical protein J7337_007998 [Fusarium musae]|uniref:Uncharacterized protein n=1 Tax=Fusarium musae TaxID=1042133 RepID=A0A9P8DD16_9HYPO|nr:hypothetical protein J7337_007998 [Fusarium musae]KAG9499542.1 hypothetical protein J7337_007998 [Fusarium musae]
MSPITDFFAFTNNMWPFSGRSTELAADDTVARDQPTQHMEMGQPRALQPMACEAETEAAIALVGAACVYHCRVLAIAVSSKS